MTSPVPPKNRGRPGSRVSGRNGLSPKVIMTLAGHKHLGTTQRYVDENDEMLKMVVEVV